MKVLGIAFSTRENGNCAKSISYCLDFVKNKGNEVEFISINNYAIEGCGECGYFCFSNGDCLKKDDDVHKFYKKCFEADKVIFAIPTFCGHLSSEYFRFWERSQAVFKDEVVYENAFLKKINFIIIGNLSSGGDMALHEAIYPFANRNFYPETILLSSRDYNRRSIKGDLIDEEDVRIRLGRFSVQVIGE